MRLEENPNLVLSIFKRVVDETLNSHMMSLSRYRSDMFKQRFASRQWPDMVGIKRRWFVNHIRPELMGPTRRLYNALTNWVVAGHGVIGPSQWQPYFDSVNDGAYIGVRHAVPLKVEYEGHKWQEYQGVWTNRSIVLPNGIPKPRARVYVVAGEPAYVSVSKSRIIARNFMAMTERDWDSYVGMPTKVWLETELMPVFVRALQDAGFEV